MAHGGGIWDGTLPAGHRVNVLATPDAVYLRFGGACERGRIRGFRHLAGTCKPDLSTEFYTGPWGSADDVDAEFARLSSPTKGKA